MIDHLPDWVLEEPVDITLVQEAENTGNGIYLVQRANAISSLSEAVVNAITLTFIDGDILINGVYIDLYDDMMQVVSLIEDANNHYAADCYLPLGETIRTEPDTE